MVAQAKERGSRRLWLDPRLGIGIVLVVASVLGVGWVVAAADGGSPVYAAKASISPGDRISASDLIVHDVRLGDGLGRYLEPGALPQTGVIATRAIGAGELIPRSAVGDSAGARVTSLVISIAGTLPSSVASGAVVELWAAEQFENGVYAAPTVLVSSATVVRLVEGDGIIADDSASVELLIPRSRIARVLEAIANDDALSIVPSSLPVAR
ncbi:hypothetical protein BH09ACT3_BH09ACT3_14520 [soil metagenome]